MRMPPMVGPKTLIAQTVHKDKYRSKNESFRDFANRVATSLQDDHDHYMKFREVLLQQIFLPAGRIQGGIGSLKNVTAQNCFVAPTIHDSFVDGPTEAELKELARHEWPSMSIMDIAKHAARTMRQGGGIGFDISTLRPRNDVIHGVQSKTDGPLAFAPIYDAVCQATSSAGNRRGAMMLMMRCDHPDIMEFIHAKQVVQDIPYQYRPLRGFNMSVAVTDKLMEHKETGKPFPLMFNGKVYREVDPNELWEMIMRSTYDWAEPGVVFIDRINYMNNLWYCEKISATNPCGEQPLPPYGSCLLGSWNLVKMLVPNGKGAYDFSWDLIDFYLDAVIRGMDNVINRSRYPTEQHRTEAFRKRRMGIGVTGLANTIEAMGYMYGTNEFISAQEGIMKGLARRTYLASIELAKEKGSFEFFDADKYCESKYIKTLDSDVQEQIKKYGIRNSHLLSIAPTGTISIAADNVSSGIEPVLAYRQKRRIIMPEGPVEHDMFDYGWEELNVHGKRSRHVKPVEHIAVLSTAQAYVDSAVSKTCNVPNDINFEDFKRLYDIAYLDGAKGCTTYRPNGNYPDVIKANDIEDEQQGPVIEITHSEPVDIIGAACGWDPLTGQRTGACSE